MFRKFVHRTFVCGLLPLKIYDDDKVSRDNRTEQSFVNYQSNETGWDRLYMMFSVDEYGAISPEINAVYQTGFLGFFIGGCMGGFFQSRLAYLNFMESNEATTFTSHMDAKRKLQNAVTVSFAKGVVKWGWRLGLFSASYVMLTTTISLYRGKSSMVEYVTAGGLTGACYKASLGLRGAAVGGGLGAVLGGVAGAASLLLLRMTGTSMEEVRYWQYHWKQDRDSQMQQMFKKHDEKQQGPMLKRHNEKVGPVDDWAESEEPSQELPGAVRVVPPASET